jgi:hypothetical protein
MKKEMSFHDYLVTYNRGQDARFPWGRREKRSWVDALSQWVTYQTKNNKSLKGQQQRDVLTAMKSLVRLDRAIDAFISRKDAARADVMFGNQARVAITYAYYIGSVCPSLEVLQDRAAETTAKRQQEWLTSFKQLASQMIAENPRARSKAIIDKGRNTIDIPPSRGDEGLRKHVGRVRKAFRLQQKRK